MASSGVSSEEFGRVLSTAVQDHLAQNPPVVRLTDKQHERELKADSIGKDPTSDLGRGKNIPFTTKSRIARKLEYQRYGVKEGMGTGKKIGIGVGIVGIAGAAFAGSVALAGSLAALSTQRQDMGMVYGMGGVGFGEGGEGGGLL